MRARPNNHPRYIIIQKMADIIMAKLLKVKVVVAGPGGVGKSCSLRTFVNGKSSEEALLTIGADCCFKTIELDGQSVRVHYWDLAGQESFGKIRKKYYGDVDGIILMIDLTRKETIELGMKYIEEEFAPCLDEREIYCLLIAANKMDLSDQIEVEDDEIEELTEFARKKIRLKNAFWLKFSSKHRESNDNLYVAHTKCMIKAMEGPDAI